MTGMIWRCGHPRTPENSTAGRKPQCLACKNSSYRKSRGYADFHDDGRDRVIAAGEIAQGSEMLLRAICREHLAIVSHFAAQGRNVRVLL